jgi:hypothetical protein
MPGPAARDLLCNTRAKPSHHAITWRIILEHDMPNRGELAIPARPADFGARDAWMVISFCAIGWLMTVSMAASMLGLGSLPKFPWG